MFFTFLISILCVFLYSVLFFITSDSPLKYASLVENLNLFSFVLLISLVLSLFFFSFVKLIKFSTSRNDVAFKLSTRIILFLILFIGFSLVAENWLYSVLGYSLKTTDSWVSKIVFLTFSSFLAYQFHSMFLVAGDVVAKRPRVVGFLICLLLLPFLISNFHSNVGDISTIDDFENIEKKLNVIVLLSDGVEASQMSIYGAVDDTTPFLHSIESEFMLFENAFTNNQNSTGSITSLLTGMSPLTTKVVYPPDILSQEHSGSSLPRLLGDFGYYRSLWGVPHYVDADSQNLEGAFNANIFRTDKTFDQLIEKKSFLDSLSQKIKLSSVTTWFLRTLFKNHSGVVLDMFFVRELDNPFSHVAETDDISNQTTQKKWVNDEMKVENILLDIEESNRFGVPIFSMIHLMRTHGSKFNSKNRIFSKGLNETEPWMSEFYQDAILDFDDAINVIYSKLKSTNMLENTIFVITSDHGMKWNNRSRVPLMIRMPNQRLAGRYNTNVQLLDIAPTIVDGLGLSKPYWMEGSSLLELSEIAPDRLIFSTGVSGNQVSKGFWVRASKDRSDFISTNKISLIHCDSFYGFTKGSGFVKSSLKDRNGQSDCDVASQLDIDNRALEQLGLMLGESL